MKLSNFIGKYGVEEQKVTKNFSAKSLGINYDIKDAFIEFCDNAYDARLSELLEVQIKRVIIIK